MRKKISLILFGLCLIKLFHIAHQSMNFSPHLFLNSFKKNAGENISLGLTASDVIPIRDFFLLNDIKKFKLSNAVHEMMKIQSGKSENCLTQQQKLKK